MPLHDTYFASSCTRKAVVSKSQPKASQGSSNQVARLSNEERLSFLRACFGAQT